MSRTEWQTIVTAGSVMVAFGVSAAVGVLFGIYPALTANLFSIGESSGT